MQKQTVTMERNPEVEMLKLKLQTRDDEVAKLHRLFEDLSSQFSMQADELKQETNVREDLVMSIQKLIQMNQYLSDKFEKISENLSNAHNENNLLKMQINNMKPAMQIAYDMQTLHDSVLNVIPTEVVDIVKPIIEDVEMAYIDRIVRTISVLSEHYHNKTKNICENSSSDCAANTNTNNKLLEIISANIRFIDSLIESKDKAQWIIKPYNFEDYRKILIEQVSRVKSYMKENSIVPVDEKTLFDSLLLEVDPIKSTTDVSEFLEQFTNGNMSEKESLLFHLLAQSIAANFALKKYSNECRNQCIHQIAEIKQLRFDVANNRQDYNAQVEDETIELANKLDAEREENERLREKIHSLRNLIIKKSANADDHDFMDLINAIDNGDDSDHSMSVINVLEGKTNELQQSKEMLLNVESDKQRILGELSALKDQKAKSEAEYLEKINDLQKSISELTTEAAATTQKLQERFNQSEEANNTLNQKITELNELVESLRSEITKSDTEIKRIKKEKKTIEDSYADYKDAAQLTMQKLIEKSRSRINKAKQDKEKAIAETKAVQQQMQEMSEANDVASEQKLQKIAELNGIISDLQSEITQTRSAMSSVQVENKLLATKLGGTEERLKRDLSIAESQFKVRAMSIETECQTKLDKQRVALEKQTTQLVEYVFGLFSVSQPSENVTVAGAQELLCDVHDKLQHLSEVEKEYSDLLLQEANVRKLLRAGKTDKITDSIQKILDETVSLHKSLKDLEAKNKAMKKDVIEARALGDTFRQNKEWEEWARKLSSLVCGGYCVCQTPKLLRHGVEEAVLGALGDKNTWMRLDLLRAQKKILKSGANLEKRGPQNLTSTMAVVRAISRLQKLSGHAQSYLTVDIPQGVAKAKAVPKDCEKKPLFNSI